MKKGGFIVRIISLFVLLLLFINMAMPAMAVEHVNFSLLSRKYSDGTFTNTSEFPAGSEVCITVNAADIASIGGITLILNYNKDLFTFKENVSFCTIQDGKGEVSFNDMGGKIITAWETTLSTTAFSSGPILCFIFSTNAAITETATGSFSFSIAELFDGTKQQNNIGFTVGGPIETTIVATSISEQTLGLFEKLKSIKYPESLDDIVAAEQSFSGLSSSQQTLLKNKYTTLYNCFLTARKKYYDLAEQAKLEDILSEISNFKSEYADVLKLTVKTVKITNETRVKSAYETLGAMSAAAKSRMDSTTKNLVSALNIEIEKLLDKQAEYADAVIEAKEFRETYSQLLKTDITPFLAGSYEMYGPLVSEAILMHGLLSEPAQKITEADFAILKELDRKIKEITANDAREQEIANAITNFQQQYVAVFKINSSNVAIEDETAIKMVLAAYEKITDKDVSGRLSNKMNQLQGFLSLIKEMKNISDDEDQSPANNDKDDETEVETKTVEKVINKLKLRETGFSTTLWVMLILLSFSIFLAIAAFYIYYLTNKTKTECKVE